VTPLAHQPDSIRLQALPGIGPVLAMIILAEARDLQRFGCARQFLKYCGFDLCTEQSGQFRGTTYLSKRRNTRLPYAFRMASSSSTSTPVPRTCDRKRGEAAAHWTRLSCHRFRANDVRLQLSVLAYDLGNPWRRLLLRD
jgi:transposase